MNAIAIHKLVLTILIAIQNVFHFSLHKHTEKNWNNLNRGKISLIYPDTNESVDHFQNPNFRRLIRENIFWAYPICFENSMKIQ